MCVCGFNVPVTRLCWMAGEEGRTAEHSNMFMRGLLGLSDKPFVYSLVNIVTFCARFANFGRVFFARSRRCDTTTTSLRRLSSGSHSRCGNLVAAEARTTHTTQHTHHSPLSVSFLLILLHTNDRIRMIRTIVSIKNYCSKARMRPQTPSPNTHLLYIAGIARFHINYIINNYTICGM